MFDGNLSHSSFAGGKFQCAAWSLLKSHLIQGPLLLARLAATRHPLPTTGAKRETFSRVMAGPGFARWPLARLPPSERAAATSGKWGEETAEPPADSDGADWQALVRQAAEWQIRSAESSEDDDDEEEQAVVPAKRQLPFEAPLLDYLISSNAKDWRSSFPPVHAARLAVSLVNPRVSFDPAPGSGGEFADYLYPALESFWQHTHPLFSMAHRPTVEKAWRHSSRLYKVKPLALLWAMAADGARTCLKFSEHQRMSYMRHCVGKVRDMLLARPVLNDLGTMQAMITLIQIVVVAGTPAQLFPLLRRAAEGAEMLYRGVAAFPPKSADQWIYREQVLRLRIVIAAMDVAQSHNSGRPTLGNYFFPHQHPLPCSENIFEREDLEQAFLDWKKSHEGGKEPTVDFSFTRNWAHVSEVAQLLCDTVFSGKTSILCLMHAATYMRNLLIPLTRSDAGEGARYDAVFLASVSDAPYRSFADLARRPDTLFSSPTLSFAFPQQRNTAAAFILCMQGHAVEVLALTGFRNSAVDKAVRAVGLAAALLKDDPMMMYGHLILLAPTFTIGKVLLETAKHLRSQEPNGNVSTPNFAPDQRAVESGVRTCARILDMLGKNYAMQAKKLAEAFHGLMLAAGLSPESPGSSVSSDFEEEEVSVVEPAEIPAEYASEAQKTRFFVEKALQQVKVEVEKAGSGQI